MTIEPKDAALKVLVAIATTRRRAIVHATLDHLRSLTDAPDRVVLAIADEEDVDQAALGNTDFDLVVLRSAKGSSAQRNAVLDHHRDCDIVLFLDDDFLIRDGYVSALRDLFAGQTDVVMATGALLADGIHGPGLNHDDGLRILGRARPPAPGAKPSEVYACYGCNMAVRTSALAVEDVRFDETLPLYGWLEDLDFSRRLAKVGRLVRDPALQGVHLGTKVSRSEGLSLGYSQVANPVYLVRKGTVQRGYALSLMLRNILANTGRSIWPEAWIDRRGRLKGNMLALGDVIRGRSHPRRILEF